MPFFGNKNNSFEWWLSHSTSSWYWTSWDSYPVLCWGPSLRTNSYWYTIWKHHNNWPPVGFKWVFSTWLRLVILSLAFKCCQIYNWFHLHNCCFFRQYRNEIWRPNQHIKYCERRDHYCAFSIWFALDNIHKK